MGRGDSPRGWKYESTKYDSRQQFLRKPSNPRQAEYSSDALPTQEELPLCGHERCCYGHSRPDHLLFIALKNAPAGYFRFFQELIKPTGLPRRDPSPRSGSSPTLGYVATLAGCPNSSKAGLPQVVSAFSCALRGPLNSKAFLPTIDINH